MLHPPPSRDPHDTPTISFVISAHPTTPQLKPKVRKSRVEPAAFIADPKVAFTVLDRLASALRDNADPAPTVPANP
jgi:hypothetical protein